MHKSCICWCGSNKKWKKCHYPFFNENASFEEKKRFYHKNWGILLKTTPQIEGIKKACKTARKILDCICENVKEGMFLYELEELSQSLHDYYGVIPAPLNYGDPPFPATTCVSLNDVVCHGIPLKQKIKNSDIMNIDVTVIENGFYGDCSKMVCVGEISEESKLVVSTSLLCLNEAIKIVRPGLLISEIGKTITSIAHERGCSVVDSFVGHGTGLFFHEEPMVFHSINNVNIPLAENMIFTIEPMINSGNKDCHIDQFDMWTARTKDGKQSAQWEETVLVTKDGVEILTKN